MSELLLIFAMKVHNARQGLLDFRLQSLAKNLSSLVIFGGFAAVVFLLARAATMYLLAQAHIGLFLFHRFLSMLLYVFFITVNLGNIIVCYATLYKSEEVIFLMGMPVSYAKIFLIKFVDNFFYSSSTLTLLGLALLLGYGSYFHMPWHFYFITMFAVLLPFMLIAALMAVLLLMLLIKVASRIGIRWLLTSIFAAYVSAIYLYFRVTNPVQLVGEVMKHYPNVNVYFGYLDPPFVRYLPNHWVSEFLYWTLNGDLTRAGAYFFILFLTMMGLMVIAALIAHAYYYKSWVTVSDARSLPGARYRPLRLSLLDFGRRSIFRSPTDVLLKRDVWLFLREPSQWLHLLLMLLLLAIFLVSIGSLEVRLTQPFLQVVSYLVVFLFNGFLIASVSLRFVFPSVSLEGDTFWAVRTSPLSLTRLYWHKFIVSFLLVLLVAEVLAFASGSLMGQSNALIAMSTLCAGFIALGLTSINLGSGSYFSVFKEKNPIRVASSQGASLTFLVSMLYLGVVLMVLVVPLNRYFDALIVRGLSTTTWIYLPVGTVAVVSLLLFFISTNLGLRSLQRDY